MLQVATLYRMDGSVITSGLQSRTVCDEAVNMAKRIARETGRSVMLEDVPALVCVRVTPAGHVWRKPRTWVPTWDLFDE